MTRLLPHLHLSRCAAPTATDGGIIRCVSSRPCGRHHQRWDLLLLPAALIWSLRPWWPNHLGRARDAGVAHTPNLRPCRACALEAFMAGPTPPHWVLLAIGRRHDEGTYVPGFTPKAQADDD